MRIFGCEAYAKELGVLKKLDERNKKLILVGYKLWNPEKRKIEIRRDVTFNENIDRKTHKKKERKTSKDSDEEETEDEKYQEDEQIEEIEESSEEEEETY
ncbi:copia-like retrotransposon family protein [Lasius niger]|uniref:Copia-like retrotransposon family protein n=1 Tax=Lasius niger TaxID=67767 RepID=A0A0J7KE53_LASNI|nr:copia-like retrotransposon family protein [Lasius niger]